MEPMFRVAGAGDVDTVLTLMQELFLEDPLPDQRAFDSSRARAAVLDLVDHPSYGRVWLLCEETVVVGYLALTFGYSLEFHGRDAFIDELYVRSPYRGRGWGTQAMKHAEAFGRSEGVRALHLEVGRNNVAAQDFYRKTGYADHDRYLMTKWVIP